MTRITDPERRVSEGQAVRRIVLAVLTAAGLSGSAIFASGLPALFLPALALVPVMLLILLILARRTQRGPRGGLPAWQAARSGVA